MKASLREKLIGVLLAFALVSFAILLLFFHRRDMVDVAQTRLEQMLYDTPLMGFNDLQTGDLVIRSQPTVHIETPFHYRPTDHIGFVVRVTHLDQILVAHARMTSPCIVLLPLSNFVNPDTNLSYYIRKLDPPASPEMRKKLLQFIETNASKHYDVSLGFDYAGKYLEMFTMLPAVVLKNDTREDTGTYCTQFVVRALEHIGVINKIEEFLVPDDFIELLNPHDPVQKKMIAPYVYLPTQKLAKLV